METGDDTHAIASVLRYDSLRRGLAYWHSKRRGRPMPARRDLDPIEIPHLLPWVLLIDVLCDPLDFRYRLIGTEVVAVSRRDFTGFRFSELAGKGPESVLWDNCLTVVRTRAPFSRRPPYIGPCDDVLSGQNLLMPLSSDGETVDMIFQLIAYQHR